MLLTIKTLLKINYTFIKYIVYNLQKKKLPTKRL